jgi:membrane peptidoglycan carboxypeptidase
VNALELSNVAATLASHGVWCPPNPIASITQPKRDRNGNQVLGADGRPAVQEVAFERPACEKAVEPGLADTLANAMSQDDRGAGTAANAAGSTGWSLPLASKTGTTEAHRSSGFLGFTNNLAAATYTYNDSPTPSELCSSPLTQCSYGTLYGGNEPARTWFNAMLPIANNFGPTALPPNDPTYVAGVGGKAVPSVVGMGADEATSRLQAAGFKVSQMSTDSGQSAGTVVFTAPEDTAIPGSTITIYVSTGQSQQPTRRSTPPTTITVPGVGPIVIPVPAG